MSPFARKPPASMTIAALLCTAMMPLTACTQPMNAKPQPEYRENPNPQQAYRLTMAIKDAPGPLKVMVSAAQYDVVNTECLPPPKENPGGRSSPVPTHDVPFELTPVSEGVYTGTVYADAMIDEDYHGRGVCRWALVQAQVQLKATGAKEETKFIASLSRSHDDFGRGVPKTLYYSKASYPAHPGSRIEDFPYHGQADRTRMSTALTDADLFTITLTAEEAGP